MSDDIEIRHGAVVAVDSRSLRGAAAQLDEIAGRLAEAAEAAGAAGWALADVDAVLHGGWSAQASGLRAEAEGAGAAARRAALRLRAAAAVYEHAELTARRAVTLDDAARTAIDARLAELGPLIALAAAPHGLGFARRAPWELIEQTTSLGWMLVPLGPAVFGATAFGFAAAVRVFDRAVTPAAARLSGPGEPVTVAQTSRRAGTPVTSLAQAVSRIPSQAAVRVERYTLPGGSRQFVVYIAGTGAGSAFDMRSNERLYRGERSASSEAVRGALERAGARPGDIVHEVGHSQGAMIAGRMALEGEYDVRTVVSAGSPIQAALPESVLSVDLRHTDDVVSALAAGGSAAGVGSPHSFVVERVADPLVSPRDLALPAHARDAYEHTAALVDASTDPRVDAVRAVFADLGRAESVEVTEYTAERP